MTHPGILFMRALAPLPLGVVRALGNALGRLLFVAARPRRRIALTNLRLCFPHWTEAERVALARRNFVYFAQAFLDRSWLWHGDPAVVRQRLRQRKAHVVAVERVGHDEMRHNGAISAAHLHPERQVVAVVVAVVFKTVVGR